MQQHDTTTLPIANFIARQNFLKRAKQGLWRPLHPICKSNIPHDVGVAPLMKHLVEATIAGAKGRAKQERTRTKNRIKEAFIFIELCFQLSRR